MKSVKRTNRFTAFSIIVTAFLLSNSVNVFSNQNSNPSSIQLKSCEISIRADRVDVHNNSVNYYGNVQFLYGLANVRANNVILTKNKDGSCKLSLPR